MASAPNTDLVCVGPIEPRWDEFDPDLAAKVLERLTEGESLKAICRDADMPSRTIVYVWLGNNDDFANNYARARATQADLFAEEIQEIADDPVLTPDDKRVRIDARKWRAARQNWRAWGDKVSHEHSVQPPADTLAPGGIPRALVFLDRRSGGDGDDGNPVDS